MQAGQGTKHHLDRPASYILLEVSSLFDQLIIVQLLSGHGLSRDWPGYNRYSQEPHLMQQGKSIDGIFYPYSQLSLLL